MLVAHDRTPLAFSAAPRPAAHFASANRFQLGGFDALQDGVGPVIYVEPQSAELLFDLQDFERASARFLGLDNKRLQVVAQPPYDVEPAVAMVESRLSRPAGFHRRPLAEPDVNLSAHPAPIKQTRQSNGVSVARIEVLLLPVASVMRPLDPTPLLQLHYEPSSLIRVGPPQCSASVRSPRGFRRLGFSLNIRATGSCSSARQPASPSRPLYAGRRPLSHQAPSELIPGEPYAPGFDDS
jgi:hypothetical protein